VLAACSLSAEVLLQPELVCVLRNYCSLQATYLPKCIGNQRALRSMMSRWLASGEQQKAVMNQAKELIVQSEIRWDGGFDVCFCLMFLFRQERRHEFNRCIALPLTSYC
jgi:hypothetical protein